MNNFEELSKTVGNILDEAFNVIIKAINTPINIRHEPKVGKPEKEPLVQFLWHNIKSFINFVFSPFNDIAYMLYDYIDSIKKFVGYWYCEGCNIQHGPRVLKKTTYIGYYCSLWWKGDNK